MTDKPKGGRPRVLHQPTKLTTYVDAATAARIEAARNGMPLAEWIRQAIEERLQRRDTTMTKTQAEKLAKRLERMEGLRVTGTRAYDGGYCLDVVDTTTGYPFVITDPDFPANRAAQADDHAALMEMFEAEGQRINAEEAND